MQILTNCPICGGNTSKKEFDCEDYTVSHEKFSIVACTTCGFKYTNPRPDKDEIGRYYESPDYISHSNSKKGIINKVYQWVRNYSLKQKVELINKHSTKGRLLDIGCGTGEFLNTATKDNWMVLGIEPSEKARSQGISNYNLNVLPEEGIVTLQPEYFDVITMWHVLEHVHTLNERVTEIYNLLKPGGKAIIAVPNCISHDAINYGNNWAAYDVPRHLYHFTPITIKALFRKHKLAFVKAYPMKFDGFYVSMLTEKNIHKTNKLTSAFLTGLASNLKAKNDAEKFSSVIYVFVK